MAKQATPSAFRRDELLAAMRAMNDVVERDGGPALAVRAGREVVRRRGRGVASSARLLVELEALGWVVVARSGRRKVALFGITEAGHDVTAA